MPVQLTRLCCTACVRSKTSWRLDVRFERDVCSSKSKWRWNDKSPKVTVISACTRVSVWVSLINEGHCASRKTGRDRVEKRERLWGFHWHTPLNSLCCPSLSPYFFYLPLLRRCSWRKIMGRQSSNRFGFMWSLGLVSCNRKQIGSVV